MWRYYNHALVTDDAPHLERDLGEVLQSDVWKNRKVYFLRYTDCFDDDRYSEWWYCLKDSVFDLSLVKAKRRYEINKGVKNFNVKRIVPDEHKEELYSIYIKAVSTYSKKTGEAFSFEKYCKSISTWKDRYITFGAFEVESDKLVGFAHIREFEEYCDFNGCKADPDYEKLGCNAALVYHICVTYNDRIKKGYYIVDGERNVLHETHFQDYLEKYFEFRKAYCRLNIIYKKWFKALLIIGYPILKLLSLKVFKSPFSEKIKAIMKMKEIAKSQRGIEN